MIFRYFIYNRKCTHHSRFLYWGSRGARALDLLLTLALYFRLRSSWRFKLPGPDFTNRFVNPFIMFTFHRGLRIRIIRPRNRTALTQSTIRHIYFAYCTHVWLLRSNAQNRSVYGQWLTKLNLGQFSRRKKETKGDKKGTKRRTKYLVSVLMRCLRHLDGIPKKKWPVSRQLPFKNKPEIFWLVGFLHISLDEKSQDIAVSAFPSQSYDTKFISVTNHQLKKLMFR